MIVENVIHQSREHNWLYFETQKNTAITSIGLKVFISSPSLCRLNDRSNTSNLVEDLSIPELTLKGKDQAYKNLIKKATAQNGSFSKENVTGVKSPHRPKPCAGHIRGFAYACTAWSTTSLTL